MKTTARDEKLLDEIAKVFDVFASDNEALALRGYSRVANKARAAVWRDAIEIIRSIELV